MIIICIRYVYIISEIFNFNVDVVALNISEHFYWQRIQNASASKRQSMESSSEESANSSDDEFIDNEKINMKKMTSQFTLHDKEITGIEKQTSWSAKESE